MSRYFVLYLPSPCSNAMQTIIHSWRRLLCLCLHFCLFSANQIKRIWVISLPASSSYISYHCVCGVMTAIIPLQSSVTIETWEFASPCTPLCTASSYLTRGSLYTSDASIQASLPDRTAPRLQRRSTTFHPTRELCCRQNKNKDGRRRIHRGRACSLERPASWTTKRHIYRLCFYHILKLTCIIMILNNNTFRYIL